MCSVYLIPWSPSTSPVSSLLFIFILVHYILKQFYMKVGRVLQLIVRMWTDREVPIRKEKELPSLAPWGAQFGGRLHLDLHSRTSPSGAWPDSVEATRSGRCGGGPWEAWAPLVAFLPNIQDIGAQARLTFFIYMIHAFFVLTPLRLKNSCATSLSLRFLPVSGLLTSHSQGCFQREMR